MRITNQGVDVISLHIGERGGERERGRELVCLTRLLSSLVIEQSGGASRFHSARVVAFIAAKYSMANGRLCKPFTNIRIPYVSVLLSRGVCCCRNSDMDSLLQIWQRRCRACNKTR